MLDVAETTILIPGVPEYFRDEIRRHVRFGFSSIERDVSPSRVDFCAIRKQELDLGSIKGSTGEKKSRKTIMALLIIRYLYGQSQVDLFWPKRYYPLALRIRTRSDSTMEPPFMHMAVLFAD